MKRSASEEHARRIGEQLLAKELRELDKLRYFYHRIRTFTLNHGVINDTACVTADKLGKALSEVNQDWHKPLHNK